MRALDLGCGHQKAAGFVGLDRFPLGGVDLVADLDAPLPFRDSVFDLVVAYHALEHVRDLPATLGEVWRVARPGAQVVVVAPYWAQGLNVANPYHLQGFNEHSPRFWTDAEAAPIAAAEYARPPQGARWGLASSDNRRPDFDLRCREIEFFYFQEYWGLRPQELTDLRRRGFDVCEQILYRLVAWKAPLGESDLAPAALVPYDPPRLAALRERVRATPPRRFSWRRLFARWVELGRL